MRPRLKRSLTLIELLISVAIMSLIVIGFASFEIYARFQILQSDRMAKIQHDTSYVLEHIAREAAKAIGNVNSPAVVIDDSNRRIKLFIDLDEAGSSYGDGKGDSANPTEGDGWAAYRYRDSSAPASEQYQVWYCPQCSDPPTCDSCTSSWEILSKKITVFSPAYSSANAYLELDITACWDPDGDPIECGGLNNPEFEIKTRMYMPLVSTN